MKHNSTHGVMASQSEQPVTLGDLLRPDDMPPAAADGVAPSQAPASERATCPAHGGDYHWALDCPECVKDARERGMSIDTYYSRVRPMLRPSGVKVSGGPCPECGRGEVFDGKCDRCGFAVPAPIRPLAALREAEKRNAGVVVVAPAPACVYRTGCQEGAKCAEAGHCCAPFAEALRRADAGVQAVRYESESHQTPIPFPMDNEGEG